MASVSPNAPQICYLHAYCMKHIASSVLLFCRRETLYLKRFTSITEYPKTLPIEIFIFL